ncbi:MAG: 3D domain-containing protein [Peptococcaceae bacterium]|nr:3D domain-containing protein [Peptococcaceae bacterium]
MQDTPRKKVVSILSITMLSLCILAAFPVMNALSQDEPVTVKETDAVTVVREEGTEDSLPEDFVPGQVYADTGCTCEAEGKQHSRFMINDSPYLYCLPVENADGTTMISLDQLARVCGYTLTREEGVTTLANQDFSYILEDDSPWLISGSRIWALPVKPYEKMDDLYVPLRFMCEVLEDVDFTYDSENKIMHLSCPQAEPDQLTLSLTEENLDRKAIVQAATIAECGDPITVVITFYHDSERWGNITASGVPATFGTVAADSSIPFGTQYYIPALDFIKGDGIFTVQDRGGAVKGNIIDVYLPETDREDPITKAAFRLGKFETEIYPIAGAQ